MNRRDFCRNTASVAGLAGLGALTSACAPADTGSILRVVPYADLQSLDPIVNTIGIVQRHAMMVYDFLFARDAQGVPRPQMIERWQASTDGRNWEFTLREGLLFHDGATVTAADVVASLRRWAARDAYGRQIFAVTSRLQVIDRASFRWDLERPYGRLLHALSKTGSAVPAIMPRRLAETSPTVPIRDATGSGPYRFLADAWIPGGVAVYGRHEGYLPRTEPPSGAAGGKRVFVDQVEWQNIRDPQSAVLALAAGEVDFVESPAAEFLPMLAREQIKIVRNDPLGTQGLLRMNHLHPPFNHPKAREALLYLIDQRRYLQAMFGDPQITQACDAYFVCGSELASTAGVPPGIGRDRQRAKALFAEAGYDGRPLVVLHATDVQSMNIATLVLADDLRSIGVPVDLQAMDFGTMASRRAIRAAPGQGGWDLGITYWPGVDIADPVSNNPMQASCDKAWSGWPCDPVHQGLIDRYPFATSDAERREIAQAIQRSAYSLVPYVPIGLWFNPVAYSPRLSGVLSMPGTSLFWNIRKAAA